MPPTVTVNATYPGASAQTVADTVAAVIEQEINGVENMIYMYSQSTSDGAMTLTVTFDIGTDIDKAQVLVQNRVASAEPRLPEEVRRSGVTVRKNNPDLLLVVHMVSPDNTYDQLYISNYALLNVRDVLARIEGAGSVNLFGAREYSMRVWLDPERIAALNLTAEEVRVGAARSRTSRSPAASIAEPPMPNDRRVPVPLQFKGRLRDAGEFEQIVIKSGRDGRVVLLKDVARVELGALNYATYGYQNGVPGDRAGGHAGARLGRAENRQCHQGGDGRDRQVVPARPRISHRLQPDRVHRGFDPRAVQDHPRGHRHGGARHPAVPADVAGDGHSGASPSPCRSSARAR